MPWISARMRDETAMGKSGQPHKPRLQAEHQQAGDPEVPVHRAHDPAPLPVIAAAEPGAAEHERIDPAGREGEEMPENGEDRQKLEQDHNSGPMG